MYPIIVLLCLNAPHHCAIVFKCIPLFKHYTFAPQSIKIIRCCTLCLTPLSFQEPKKKKKLKCTPSLYYFVLMHHILVLLYLNTPYYLNTTRLHPKLLKLYKVASSVELHFFVRSKSRCGTRRNILTDLNSIFFIGCSKVYWH